MSVCRRQLSKEPNSNGNFKHLLATCGKIFGSNHPQRVQRRSGERYISERLQESVKQGGGSVMVGVTFQPVMLEVLLKTLPVL